MQSTPGIEQALSWAREALMHYALQQPAVRFLGHSDNITFQVEDQTGKRYLLRLHRPALDAWSGIRQKPEVIASELVWLEALDREKVCPVQQPVRCTSGSFVAEVNAGEKTLPATLLVWLDGTHFSPSAPDAPSHIERFGQLVARLHCFSESWQPEGELIRPSYDHAHFKKTFARLLHGVDLGVFPEEVYRTLRATARAVLTVIEDLPVDREHWGLVHADLHMGNFLVNGQEIIPIDYSFSGFGHYLFDLSVCLAGGLNAGLRPRFLQGYRSVRPLPAEDFRAIDAFALAGRLGYYASQMGESSQRSWLQRRIPEVAENECRRFLAGRPIFAG